MPSTAAGKPDAKGYRLMIPSASRHTDKTLPCSSAHTSPFIILPASPALLSECTPDHPQPIHTVCLRVPDGYLLRHGECPTITIFWNRRRVPVQHIRHQDIM